MKRAEYMATGMTREERDAAFEVYYAQYVTPEIRALVVSSIGFHNLFASRDSFLNDIDISAWCRMEPSCKRLVDVSLLQDNKEIWSDATAVCILKVAARQIVALHSQKESV